MSESRLKIFCGNSNPALAQEICKYLQMPLGAADVVSFPDGESFVRINENIRGADVFIIQSTSNPANQNLMELFIMIDAARRASDHLAGVSDRATLRQRRRVRVARQLPAVAGRRR